MNIPRKALRSGFSLPVLGLGTWGIGGRYEADRTDDEVAIASIRRAIDAGVRHIDGAERYGDGHTEELIGRAIDGIDRSTLQITSKVWSDHLHRDDLIRSAEQSLTRLKTDYTDLYLIHWPNPEVPLQESIEALNTLVDRGLTRAIGVSNFSTELLKQAQALSKHPIVANQVHYSLVCREPEHSGLLDHCTETDVLLVAYRPLRVVLTEPAPILQEMATKYGATPAQIALRWVTMQPSTVALCKMGGAHLRENLGALTISLTPEDIDALKRLYPGQQAISDVVPKR